MKTRNLILLALMIVAIGSVNAQWSLSGNAISTSNFLGSTNTNPVVFKVNSSEKMRILSTGYIGIGTTTPNNLIQVAGLINFDNNRSSTFLGSNAGISATGTLNTGIGNSALKLTTSGIKNTAIGFMALQNNTTGGGNTAVGNQSLTTNTTGSKNTVLGFCADVASATLSNATAIGANAYVGASNCLVLGGISGVNSGTSTNVGIGTTTPKHILHVNGNITIEGLNSTLLFGQNYPTTSANWGQWGIEYEETAGGLNFWKPFGSNNFGNFYFFIKDQGNVGIGTTNFSNGVDANFYKLSVNGNIRAKEIVVETGWSDFVFDKEYKLLSLSEVEQYIKENKHLPDVPSADNVAKNGVSLGRSDAVLLQKIEELTLYIIEMQKQIDLLKTNK